MNMLLLERVLRHHKEFLVVLLRFDLLELVAKMLGKALEHWLESHLVVLEQRKSVGTVRVFLVATLKQKQRDQKCVINW
ncbi:hypothetical protein GEV33_000227 [Tenebrio molitor]|uniref:Uncharacterized protein n=1 Tax=Tenebrio molitor TaxID=7067 RepID=A0A8J6LH63_TENMO|nr:hypothetical protein GEV33_000227 [Tenebrio molitor]